MNFWDWLGLSLMLTTLLGAEVTPKDHNHELVATTPAQAEARQGRAVAGVAMGGKLLFQFADSGLSMAEERAIDARESLNRAIFHYDIANKYVALGLRTSGNGHAVDLYYFDLRLMTATTADAQAAGEDSAQALASAWRGELDRAFRALPKDNAMNWVTTTGSVAGATMLSDATLASTATEVLRYAPGQALTLTAKAGVIIVEGTVPTDAQRRRVVRTLKGLPGVRAVQDKMEVKAAGR